MYTLLLNLMQAAERRPPRGGTTAQRGGDVARKIQLGLLIMGMLLVGVSRFVATASASAEESTSPTSMGGMPLPGR